MSARISLFVVLTLLLATAGLHAVVPNGFSYQGVLRDSSVPYTGLADFQFTLWDSAGSGSPPTGGTQVGVMVPVSGVQVTDGLFNVNVDFGVAPYNGNYLWLQIAVRKPREVGFTILSPRQRISPTPYSLFSYAPWVSGGKGNSIYYDKGNVGIGTASPLADLHLEATSISAPSTAFSGEDAIIEDTTAVLGLYGDGSGTYVSAISLGQITSSSLVNKWSLYRLPSASGSHLRFSFGSNAAFTSNASIMSLDGPNARVGIGTTSPATTLDVAGIIRSSSGGFRFPDGSTQTTAATLVGSGIDNFLARWNGSSSLDKSLVYVTDAGFVGIGTSTPTSKLQVWNGDFTILSASGDKKMDVQIDEALSTGYIRTYGANNSKNAGLLSLTGYPNNGYVCVFDQYGVNQAGIYVNSSGTGTVYADVKSFRKANPRLAETEIVYACIEGPEAAAYIRGTTALKNGRARVALPEHFQDVASAKGITVQLTPCSADSKGLAVIEKATDHFTVQELMGGTGSYEFDWRVEAVRSGHESFRVIQSNKEAKPEMGKGHNR